MKSTSKTKHQFLRRECTMYHFPNGTAEMKVRGIGVVTIGKTHRGTMRGKLELTLRREMATASVVVEDVGTEIEVVLGKLEDGFADRVAALQKVIAMKKLYMLVDGRADPRTPEPFARHHSECAVYTVADSIEEAVSDRKGFPDAVLVECDVLETDKNGFATVTNEGKVIPWPE